MSAAQMPAYRGTDAPPYLTRWGYRHLDASGEVEILRIIHHGSTDWSVEVDFQPSKSGQLTLDDRLDQALFEGVVHRELWLEMLKQGQLTRLPPVVH